MNKETILSEITIKAVRSSGPGGQNVNKVSSKIILFFDVNQSKSLTIEEKEQIKIALASRLNSDFILILSCDENRSQLKNKEIVIKRLIAMLSKALIVPKKRTPTKIPKAIIKKRLKYKSSWSQTKQLRKKPRLGNND